MRRSVTTVVAFATLTALVLAGDEARAAGSPAPQPSGASSWAIVLVSKDTPEQARTAFAELTVAARRWVRPASGYPRLIESASVPGFRPGYHVVVLGYCASKQDAADAHAWVKLDAPEAYFKKVDVELRDACPQTPDSAIDTVTELVESLEVPGARDLRLDVVSGNPRRQEECNTRDMALVLRRGADIVDEAAFTGSCLGACTKADKAAGARQVAAIQAAIDRGEATESELDYDFTGCRGYEPAALQSFRNLGAPVVLMKEETAGPHDSTYPKYVLVAATPGCNVVRSEEFEFPHVSSYIGATVGELEARPVGKAGFRHFRLHDPSLLVNGADARAVVEVKLEGCALKVTPLEVPEE